MSRDTRAFISASCARSESSHQPLAGQLRPLPVPSRPWSHTAVDFITRHPPSNGNTTILTIFNHFSKVLLVTIHSLRNNRPPGPSYFPAPWNSSGHCLGLWTSVFIPVFFQALGAATSLCSGYHPYNTRQTERANQNLESTSRCVTERRPASWSTHLSWIKYAHNSLIISATGMSPFMASVPLFPAQEEGVSVPSVQANLCRCCSAGKAARAALNCTAEQNQCLADQCRSPAPNYQPRQKVWLSSRALPLQVETSKLAPCYIGPFEIQRIINPSAVRLKLLDWLKIHSKFQVSLLKPVSTSPLSLPDERASHAIWLRDTGWTAFITLVNVKRVGWTVLECSTPPIRGMSLDGYVVHQWVRRTWGRISSRGPTTYLFQILEVR